MPCGPVANRVPYPLVADGLSAGIPYTTPVGGATDFIPCALRPRPLLQSVAHPQVGVHSGYSREPYAYARLAHYFPDLSLSRRVPTTPPTINGNFHSGYSRLTVNLRSARTLILLTYRLAAAIPRYGSFRYADTGMAIRGPHEVILPEVIIVLHFSPCWYLLRTFLRSDKLRPNGGKSFQSLKNWKALDPTVMSRTTCCATTMISLCQIPRSGTASSTCGDVYINFVKDLL